MHDGPHELEAGTAKPAHSSTSMGLSPPEERSCPGCGLVLNGSVLMVCPPLVEAIHRGLVHHHPIHSQGLDRGAELVKVHWLLEELLTPEL